MSFVKRNIGLVVFCTIALVVALIMVVLLKRYYSQAADFEVKVAEQRNFFRDLRTRDIPVNEANLEVISENHDITQENLLDLQNKLWVKSRISVQSVRDFEAKNSLDVATREMQQELENEGVLINEKALSFSFGDIINAEQLPDEETEVPTIMKQLKVVREIVRLTGQAGIRHLVRLERPMKLQSEEKEAFQIMPFLLTVEGKETSVKKLVTSLQSKAEYLFAVQHFTVFTNNHAEDLLEEGIGTSWKAQREAADSDERLSPRGEDMSRREMMRFEEGREEDESEEEKTLPKEARLVGMRNSIRLNLRVDFLEFKEPESEQE